MRGDRPGAATGPDATRLQRGDWVFCDPTVRSRDGGLTPDITLQGWSARGEGGHKLQRYFRDGAFAQQLRVPTENAVPIGLIHPDEAGQWCAVNTLLIAYGGVAGDGAPPRRNAAGERCHGQSRLRHGRGRAGDWGTLPSRAGSAPGPIDAVQDFLPPSWAPTRRGRRS